MASDTSNKNYFIELNGEKHRLLVIEYFDDKPCAVTTEEHWNHSKNPWFDPSRHVATGTCPMYFIFEYSKSHERTYWHKTGMGGDGSKHSLGKLVNGRAIIWAAPDIVLTKIVKRKGDWVEIKASPRDIERFGYTVAGSPKKLSSRGEKASINPFEFAQGDTECVYCPRCKDYLPDDSFLCEHTRWCDECEEWILIDTKEHIDGDGKCEHNQEFEY